MLRFTLLSDGSSDRVLLPMLEWLLTTNGVTFPIQPQWADLRRMPNPPRELHERMVEACRQYPCDLMFIHRDAENAGYQQRVTEIRVAITKLDEEIENLPIVCVIPVRMQEAWFLFDEQALREASGNPRGRQKLNLPPIRQCDQIADPKTLLHKLLRQASGRRGRRLKQFKPEQAVHLLALNINNFSPLRALDAFKVLEADVQKIIIKNGWNKLG